MKYKAVIFDVDGVLLDSGEYIYSAFEHTFTKNNIKDITKDDINKFFGKSLAGMLKGLVPDMDPEKLTDDFREWQEAHFDLIKPFANAEKALSSLRDSGIKIGALSSRKKFVAKTLKLNGLLPYIDMLLSGADVENMKPHPEGVQKILSEFQIEPHQAIMVGDTPEDVEAGKNAGTDTVGVTYGLSDRLRIKSSEPSFLIDDIEQVLEILN
jgi:pyrophosphatase PpaX